MFFSITDLEEINNFLDEQLRKASDDEMIDLIIKDNNYLMGLDDEFDQILDTFRFTVSEEYEYSSTNSKRVGFKDELEATKEFLFFDPPQKISDPTFELDPEEERKRLENENKAKEEHMKLIDEYIRKSRESRKQKENIPKRNPSNRLEKCRPPPLVFTCGDGLAKL
jgi:hypothetical protein